MSANEWLEVIKQSEDYNPAMTSLIIKYGEILLEEHKASEEAKEENAVDIGKLVKRIGELVVEKTEFKEECDRLAGLVEYWQTEYYKLNPPRQPVKLDNF